MLGFCYLALGACVISLLVVFRREVHVVLQRLSMLSGLDSKWRRCKRRLARCFGMQVESEQEYYEREMNEAI